MKKTIVISGKPGAGSSSVAKALAEDLNFSYFSPGTVFKMISKGNIEKIPFKKEVVLIFKEQGIDITKLGNRGGLLSFWGDEIGSSKKFHEALDAVQIFFAKKGSIVIDGKLSITFLKEYTDVSVWVNARKDIRAKRYVKRENISLKDALELIRKRELFERKNWKKIYGFDYFTQEQKADVVIDSTNKNIGQIVSFIKNKL